MGQGLSLGLRKLHKHSPPAEATPLTAEENHLLTSDGDEEREVKKANRELNNLTSKMDDLQKIETLQKRVTEHLADMKRLERDNQKNKKRGDILQKEKDHSRTELSKSVTLREKLEKLCRELQRENNRLKVCLRIGVWRSHVEVLICWVRARTRRYKILRRRTIVLGTTNLSSCFGSCKTIKTQKIILKRKSSILRLKNCSYPVTFSRLHLLTLDRSFKQRFKSLIDQYELRELHFHSLLRSKELEVQYHMARFNKEQKSAEAEVTRSRALNAQVLTFSKTESELRSQLNIYVEKFKQVRFPSSFLSEA